MHLFFVGKNPAEQRATNSVHEAKRFIRKNQEVQSLPSTSVLYETLTKELE